MKRIRLKSRGVIDTYLYLYKYEVVVVKVKRTKPPSLQSYTALLKKFTNLIN